MPITSLHNPHTETREGNSNVNTALYLNVTYSTSASMSVCWYSKNWIQLSFTSSRHKRQELLYHSWWCVSTPSGTRNAILNTEARTVEAEVLSRRCVIMRLADFSYEEYQKALRQSAGAVVIILPKNMSTVPQDIVQVTTLISQIHVWCLQCKTLSEFDLHIYSTRRRKKKSTNAQSTTCISVFGLSFCLCCVSCSSAPQQQ